MKNKENMFDEALCFKKKTNIILCVLTMICGITSVIYKVNYEGGFWTCFREMTVNGTVFSTVVAFFLIILNSWEIIRKKEFMNDFWYYIRLSSVVTETIIFIVVLIGYIFRGSLPNDNPVFFRYDMIMMHILVPVLVIGSFCVNDTPVGVNSKWKRFYGASFVTVYAVVMEILILSNVIPTEKIPYSFLDVRHTAAWFILLALVLIYLLCYLLSWLYIFLNKRIYWKSYSIKWMNHLMDQ